MHEQSRQQTHKTARKLDFESPERPKRSGNRFLALGDESTAKKGLLDLELPELEARRFFILDCSGGKVLEVDDFLGQKANQ